MNGLTRLPVRPHETTCTASRDHQNGLTRPPVHPVISHITCSFPFRKMSLADFFQEEGECIIEGRMGRMEFDGKRVKALPEIGALRIIVYPSDPHIHLTWTAGHKLILAEAIDFSPLPTPDLSLVISSPSSLEIVDAAKTGRVYILKQSESEVRNFFWGQEEEEKVEKKIIEQFNKYLGNPTLTNAMKILMAEDEFVVAETCLAALVSKKVPKKKS